MLVIVCDVLFLRAPDVLSIYIIEKEEVVDAYVKQERTGFRELDLIIFLWRSKLNRMHCHYVYLRREKFNQLIWKFNELPC
jgi:hypothetical protein